MKNRKDEAHKVVVKVKEGKDKRERGLIERIIRYILSFIWDISEGGIVLLYPNHSIEN